MQILRTRFESRWIHVAADMFQKPWLSLKGEYNILWSFNGFIIIIYWYLELPIIIILCGDSVTDLQQMLQPSVQCRVKLIFYECLKFNV